jgi:hypothetical protein
MGELLKMAMVGGTAAGPAVAGGGAVTAGVNVKIAAAVVAVAVGIGGIAVYQNVSTDRQEAASRNSVKVNTSVSAEGNRAVGGAISSGRETAVQGEGGFGNGPDLETGAARSAGARSVGRDAGARGSAESGAATATGDGGSATQTSDVVAGEGEGSKVNLTSPEKTVESFMSLLEAGDLESLGECFVEGAEDYGDLRRIMEEPATEEEAQFGVCLRSLGGPVEIVESLEGASGLEVKWVCTVKVEFSFGGMTWGPGDKFELDGRLVQVEGQWKIAGI